MMPKFISDLSKIQLTSRGGRFARRWLLSLFVAVLCTNLAKPAPALASEASLTPVGSITKALTNHDVTVQAVISNVREPNSDRAPYIVSLTEGGATLPLVYWPDMQPQLAPKVKVGNLIRVTARVNLYRDNLQLRLRSVTALDVVTAAAASAETATNAPSASPTTPTETVIGAIKADWADRVVIISGTIAASDNVDKVQRISVQDATGEIKVVLGEKALSGLAPADFQPGRAITITGPVKLENGTRTIVPEAAGAVKLAPQ
jgi:DNA/RNA endonuclease YhcR with UshA esterase domain